VYDSLHDFAIAELKPHPYSMDDRRAGMEVECLVLRVSLEAVDIENGFNIPGWNLFVYISFEMPNTEGFW